MDGRTAADQILIDVQELAIAPAYQSQGLGKTFILHLIEMAKAQRINIALAASSGTFLAPSATNLPSSTYI